MLAKKILVKNRVYKLCGVSWSEEIGQEKKNKCAKKNRKKNKKKEKKWEKTQK